MKRLVLLFAIGLLLAACGSTSTETAVTEPEEVAKPETAVVEEEPAAETDLESESNPDTQPEELAAIAGFPATNVAEASIVRDRDWTLGTDDPLVTIIEYGDFQ